MSKGVEMVSSVRSAGWLRTGRPRSRSLTRPRPTHRPQGNTPLLAPALRRRNAMLPPCQPSPCAAATTVPPSPSRSSSSAALDASRDSLPAPSLSDKESTIGGISTAAPPLSLRDEFPTAAAMGPYASSRWSDVPVDILMRILQLLELPEALAFGAVCPSWRSASTAAGGVPPCRTPWLVSFAEEPLLEGEQWPIWDPTVSSEFRNLLKPEKAFQVSFPRGVQAVVACCGASHGWLIIANELSDLVLYNPFAMALIPLPPITAFAPCIEGVYGDEGNNIVAYRYTCWRGSCLYDLNSLGRYFYDKVVLSGSPSLGRRCVALVIHLDSKQLSFARVGDDQGCWRQISVIKTLRDDCFTDCVYHNGRFYTVTLKGKVKSWNLCGLDNKPKKKVIAKQYGGLDLFDHVITRYLVSTPWGRLLQVRVILGVDRENPVWVEIHRLDLKRRKMVKMSSARALRGHAVFLGQNSSGCLSASKFPELRPDCIYFTAPRPMDDMCFHYLRRRHIEWSGVKVYDLKKGTLEEAFPSGGRKYGTIYSSEIWFTPTL